MPLFELTTNPRYAPIHTRTGETAAAVATAYFERHDLNWFRGPLFVRAAGEAAWQEFRREKLAASEAE